MSAARENLAPHVVQRVAKELRSLVLSPPSGIRYVPQDEEVLTEIRVEIEGPENTPYEGAFFLVRLSLSEGFPQAPPRGVFLTKIFHPNIATNGEICVNTLKKDWSPSLGIAHVLQVIRCLLIVPFPESSLNDEAGRLFMESYDEYARRAKLWASIHAPKVSAVKTSPDNNKKQSDKSADPTSTSGTGSLDEAKRASSSEKAPATDSATHDGSDATDKRPAAAPASSESSSASKPVVLTASAPIGSRKRVSPTSSDALAAAQKKKALAKKSLKRL
ncbi:hypothetical protein P43SY_004282 [Pythium insidiosum]|uniref:E2 ubiquitin-conjugating enzyme n=1 Tax=Pythium insidiosum TaxID=114742 RepID=A0AAD5Q2H7_PYTIN|nr:hypothetical protein P43SY_004282 [Pythium insidiosum]KAJ0395664.1 hypothetical protein ATCC90586_006211 [Pythium insidiosum]